MSISAAQAANGYSPSRPDLAPPGFDARLDTLEDTTVPAVATDVVALEAAQAVLQAEMLVQQGLISKAIVTLTAAEVKLLLSANIELVPEPAAGFAVVPVAIALKLDHGGNNDFVQTAGTDHLAVRWSGAQEIQELGSEALCTTLLEGAADTELFAPITTAKATTAPTAALDLDNNGAAEYSGNAAGDNTLVVTTYYRTVAV